MTSIGQALGRRSLGQDAEPGEGIETLIDAKMAPGKTVAGNPMEAVAAGNEIAGYLFRGTAAFAGQAGARRVGAMDGDILDLESEIAAGGDPSGDEVFDDLGLAINRDRPSCCIVGEPDRMALPSERDVDAILGEAELVQLVGDASLPQQVHRALLQHAGADSPFDVRPITTLKNDRVDAADMEKLRQEKTRRSGADDSDLGARSRHPGGITYRRRPSRPRPARGYRSDRAPRRQVGRGSRSRIGGANRAHETALNLRRWLALRKSVV